MSSIHVLESFDRVMAEVRNSVHEFSEDEVARIRGQLVKADNNGNLAALDRLLDAPEQFRTLAQRLADQKEVF